MQEQIKTTTIDNQNTLTQKSTTQVKPNKLNQNARQSIGSHADYATQLPSKYIYG